jgi:hypothetical protein
MKLKSKRIRNDFEFDGDVFRNERKNINKAIKQTERNVHKPIVKKTDLNHITNF